MLLRQVRAGSPEAAALLDRSTRFEDGVDDAVSAILRDIRVRGDEAVADYTRRFDQREPPYEVTSARWDELAGKVVIAQNGSSESAQWLRASTPGLVATSMRGGAGVFYQRTSYTFLTNMFSNGRFSDSFIVNFPTNTFDPGPRQGNLPTDPFLVNGPVITDAMRAELERLFRDARLGRIHPGNTLLTHEVVGKSLPVNELRSYEPVKRRWAPRSCARTPSAPT